MGRSDIDDEERSEDDALPAPGSDAPDDDALDDDALDDDALDDEDERGDTSDLGIDDIDDLGDDDGPAGLYDEEGVEGEESLFGLDLPPTRDARTGDDDEDADGPDSLPIEGLDIDEEYGWSDTDASGDEPLDPADLDLPTLSPLDGDDGGEEGVDEVFDLTGDDDAVPHLRGLGDRLADEEELLGDAAFEEDVSALPRRAPSSRLPEPVEPGLVEVTHLGPGSDPVLCLDGPPVTLAAGADIHSVGDRSATRLSTLVSAGVEGALVVSIARRGDAVAIALRPTGVAYSNDAGASFRAAAPVRATSSLEAADGDRAPDGELSLHAECGPGDHRRLWGHTAAGALMRSDDFGASWSGPLLLRRVVAIATPEEGGVLAFSAGGDAPPQLARSVDGGQRWTAALGPSWTGVSELGGVHLAACGAFVAVAAEGDEAGPYLSRNAGERWARLPGLPATSKMALLREPEGLALYAAHPTPNGAVVARHQPDGGDEGVSVLDLAVESARVAGHGVAAQHAPRRLVVNALSAVREGVFTVLYVATSIGLFRVRVDTDGAS